MCKYRDQHLLSIFFSSKLVVAFRTGPARQNGADELPFTEFERKARHEISRRGPYHGYSLSYQRIKVKVLPSLWPSSNIAEITSIREDSLVGSPETTATH
jgi:hypothetical protein